MKTGFIGLGAMGAPMAANVHSAGFLTHVWNRTRQKADALAAELGVTAAADPATLAAGCELILTCVSRDADIRAVIEALLPGLQPGSIVVDCSTVADDTARELAEQVAGRGASFLDAPVSGGVEGARKGSLAMFVGGDADVLERARPVLETMAGRIEHMGLVGAGQAAKAVNQIIVAGLNQAISEGIAFGVALGLPMKRLVEVLSHGAAGNWWLQNRGHRMLVEDFEPGFRMDLHEKDLQIVRHMAQRHGAQMPLVEMTAKQYQRLMDAGHGAEDITALVRDKHRMFEASRDPADEEGGGPDS